VELVLFAKVCTATVATLANASDGSDRTLSNISSSGSLSGSSPCIK
jgi:hypothetical protein